MSFKNSQMLGKQGEEFVLSLLKKNGYTAAINENKETRSEYDISVQLSPRKKILLEVKLDKMACTTGNLAMEYYNPKAGKDSGINITKANIWVHIILDSGNPTVWFAKVTKLKDFLKTVKPKKTIAAGGDKNASLYLYDIDVILPAVFHRMENLHDKEAFQKIITSLIGKEK